MAELTLERREQTDDTAVLADGEGMVRVMMTPPIGEDYWEFRVKLTDAQAIVGFPKFGMIGIGFAVESDWNTNLPAATDAELILNHIRHNKGDDSISDADCLTAIRMIQDAAAKDRQ